MHVRLRWSAFGACTSLPGRQSSPGEQKESTKEGGRPELVNPGRSRSSAACEGTAHRSPRTATTRPFESPLLTRAADQTGPDTTATGPPPPPSAGRRPQHTHPRRPPGGRETRGAAKSGYGPAEWCSIRHRRPNRTPRPRGGSRERGGGRRAVGGGGGRSARAEP
jgi:hypothetical protein